jgi:glucose-1-phosphate adenylyltransferase
VGRHAQIRRTIVDKGVQIPPGTRIGFDPKEDRARGLTVTESGLTVVPKWHSFTR